MEKISQSKGRGLSKDFGVPHVTLAQSYARELLNVKPFPAFAGYSSRLMAESWDSSNLYWARLADDMGYSDAGCYGGDIDTPHLDSLASNGLRYTQAYSTARCGPSRGCCRPVARR